VAISGYSWLFAFRGYFFSRAWLFISCFVAIRGYPWLSVAILQKNSRVAIFPRGYFPKVSQIPMLPTREIAVKIAVCKNSRAFKSIVKHSRKIAVRAWLFLYARVRARAAKGAPRRNALGVLCAH